MCRVLIAVDGRTDGGCACTFAAVLLDDLDLSDFVVVIVVTFDLSFGCAFCLVVCGVGVFMIGNSQNSAVVPLTHRSGVIFMIDVSV